MKNPKPKTYNEEEYTVKREPLGFLIIISGIFLISIGIVYPKDDVEIVIQTGHSEAVTSVAISPDGQTIVSGSDDHTVRIWDKKTGMEIRRLQGHTGSVKSVAISADGQTIVSGSDDYTIILWDK